jgi:plastocyanin
VTKTLRVLLVLLAAMSLGAAGCGGDDNKSTTQSNTATSTTDTTKTETTGGAAKTATSVAMKEYEFNPSDVSVKQGASITVKNEGQIAHNLTVEKGSQKVAGTDTFLGGKSEKLKVDATPGKYTMVCTVPGHEDLGMKGDFTVTK